MKEKPSWQLNPWKTKTSEEVYDNTWISVHHNEVLTPGGSEGIYGKVHFKNLAVGIIPLDAENNTWLVGQYRYTLDAYSWEIPEGGCPVGEEALAAAQRELKEETGLVANEWKEILTLHTSNSVSDEKAIIYVARDLELGVAEPEDTEALELRKLPFAEVVEMVLRGEITDAMSVAGVLRVARELDK